MSRACTKCGVEKEDSEFPESQSLTAQNHKPKICSECKEKRRLSVIASEDDHRIDDTLLNECWRVNA